MDLQNEFKNSGAVTSLQIPEQHRIYGLDTAFRPDHYAFEWWPVQLSYLEMSDREFLPLSLNWPSTHGTPPHAFKPDVYRPMNFPALITGKDIFGDKEQNEKSLHDLLLTMPADGHPLLIYYHCVAGKDRTGATSMGYLMTYGGYPLFKLTEATKTKAVRSQPMSYAAAKVATTIPEHPANPFSLKLATAYCISLGRKPADCVA
jgi:hypothetical protein